MYCLKTVLTRKEQKVYAKRKLPDKGEDLKSERVYLIVLHHKGKTVIKIGTTNDIRRRLYEHMGYYKVDITVCWVSPKFSKYTTLRVEDMNKAIYKTIPFWEWIKKDRFIIPDDTPSVIVKVKKDYHIPILKYVES